MVRNYQLFLVSSILLLAACGGDDAKVDGADSRGGPLDVVASDVTDALTAPETIPLDAPGDLIADVPNEPTVLDFVEPMIGTGGLSYRLGNVFIGATLPFGMAKVGPDTKHDPWGEPGFTHCEGYWYDDTHVAGFSQIHIHGTGAPDYASLLVQPSLGMDDSKVTETGYMLPLDHELEENHPGYYRIAFEPAGIMAELTATTRVALHRYTFPDTDDAVIIVDPSHVIPSCEVDDTDISIDVAAGTIEGYLHAGCSLSGRFGGYPLYFHARFRTLPAKGGVWQDDLMIDGDSAEGPETGAWFRFDATADAPIELLVGLSFVDLENARRTLDDEVGEKSFDNVRALAEEAWLAHFDRAKVEFSDDTPDSVVIQYYTSLYHSMLMPSTWSDSDGRYLAFDDTVHQTDEFTYYTDFSMWDTYRTPHPLISLLFPERSSDMLQSLLDMATFDGCLPIWVLANGDSGSMIGRPASLIVADGWLHGIDIGEDSAMYKTLLQSHAVPVDDVPVLECSGVDGMHDYLEYGYHPYDMHDDSVSITMELAWADYCVGRVAEKLGEDELAKEMYARSLFPYNLYNPEQGFFMAKDSQGEWHEKLDPTFWEAYYTEGNAWQYLWLMPHDPGGLVETLGGMETFLARLNEYFDETEAWDNPLTPPKHHFQGNEPDIHAPFMYSAVGDPASSAKWSWWLMDKEYYVDPEGLAGNDDAGTLAAWYVFATLGFYPIPCSGRYLLGAPRVKEAWVSTLGKTLHMVVENASESRPYIDSITWNGTPVTVPWFTIEQLQQGGEVVFTMSEEPTDFGTDIDLQTLASEKGLE
jgi:predicted alpha-1,2-mannosidase